MTKRIIAEEIGDRLGSRAQAEEAVDAVFDAVRSAVDRGETIQIRGFGTFAMKTRKGRIGRNPQTGAPIDIPAKREMAFKLPRKAG